MFMSRVKTAVSLFSLVSWASGALAADLAVDAEESVLAIVTHKRGLAARLAHDHLVVAGGYELDLEFDPLAPAATEAELELVVDRLVVDDPADQRLWYPHLERLDVLDEPFSALSDADRGKIRAAMLGTRQLDAERFPKIRARTVEVRQQESSAGQTRLAWMVDLELEVHGRAVTRPLAARFTQEGDGVVVEALGSFRFSDFGIKPYSAMLGAVKNDDPFHVFIHLRLVPE